MKNWWISDKSIFLEEGPWYIFFLAELSMGICDILPSWELPIIGRITIIKDNEKYTINEYYGGFRDLFHCFVDIPIQDFCWKRIKLTHKYSK